MKTYYYDVVLSEGVPMLATGRVFGDSIELHSRSQLGELVRGLFDPTPAEEYVYLLPLNTAGKLLGIFEVSHGGNNFASVRPREVFMRLLLIGSNSFMIVHNHPGGSFEPSEADKAVMKTLNEAGKLMKIPMLEFIVAGELIYTWSEKEGEAIIT